MFITVADLLDYLRVTFSPDSSVSFDQRFQAIRTEPFLILDDLGSKSTSPWAQEKLFQILDYRYVARLPTVITTATPIEKLNERVQSRLLDERRCLIFAITAAGFSNRMKRGR